MESITLREQAVLVGLAQGLNIVEVSDRLRLSKATVYRALQSSAHRLGQSTPVGTISKALNLGLVDPGLRLSPEGRIVRSISAAVRKLR